MSTKRKLWRPFRRLLRNPLVIIPPLVILLAAGWQQYTYAGRDLSLPGAKNLLPNSSFSQFGADGAPIGWQLTTSGKLDTKITPVSGYASGTGVKLAVRDYQNGNAAFSTPKVPVQANTTYLFKGYYSATAAFSLLAREYYSDGSSNLRFVQAYQGASGTWSTASYAFQADGRLRAVQFVYHLYANGTLMLNSPYLEPRQDVYLNPAPTVGTNQIPNGSLAADGIDMPSGWTTYHSGANDAMFTYQPDSAGSTVQTTIQNHQTGQAKWQYPPQPVTAHQYFQFSVDYQSSVPAPVIAEYQRPDGSIQDVDLGRVLPSDDWTTVIYSLEVPTGASNLFVSLPLQRNGTLSTRHYQLVAATHAGAAHWQKPLVSVTFDDGWQLSYSNALPVLDYYGYKATFYINPSVIETPNFMTASELSSLNATDHEIAAHGYDHDDMTALSEPALNAQLQRGRDYLQAAGFTVTDFAAPYGRTDSEVQHYARKYYATLRGTDTGINTRQTIDPYNLKVLYVSDFTKPKTIAEALRTTTSEDGWLILVYHRIGDNLTSYKSLDVETTSITTAAFKQQMKQINMSGISVLPVNAAYASLEKQ